MLRWWFGFGVVAVCIATAIAYAAPDHVLRGNVIDRATGEPIEGAVVVGARETAATDASGSFTITVGADERELVVTAPGHALRVFRLVGLEQLNIELERASADEVIDVEGRAPEVPAAKTYTLTSDELRSLAGTGNDALRAAQALPGVARLPYSFGGIVLRGTSPRDNVVFVDGIEVPFAFHFGGVTAFYPSPALSSLTVNNGGLDAAYGRAQGGMVNLTTREPRTDKWRTSGSIGLLDAGVSVEGPVRSGGIIIGLRRSYFDIVAAPVAPDDVPLPSYWDAQVRTSFGDATKHGRITPMLFLSLDNVATAEQGKEGFEDESDLRAFFVRVAAPYRRQYRRLELRVVPWIGTNQLLFSSRTSGVRESFERPVYLGGLRTELTRDTTWGQLRGGLDFEGGHLSRYQAGFGSKDDIIHIVNGESTVNWLDKAIWGETSFGVGDHVSLKPGLRLEHYGLTGEAVVDPRLTLQVKLTETFTLREAVGRYHQPPTPGDVDRNGGHPRLKSSYMDSASLGVDGELAAGWTSSLTGYYGYGQRLGVRANPDEMSFTNLGGLGPTFELLLEKQLGLAFYRENTGRARNAGLELMVKHSTPRWFGLLAYTLSNAERTDDPKMHLGWRAFELDQRHNLNVAGSVSLTPWRLGARIHIVSGGPQSPPLEGNLPVFFQLDVRADRRWAQCWGDVNLYFDIQNVTNRRNIEGRNFDTETLMIDEQRGLPIAPFIGVELLPK